MIRNLLLSAALIVIPIAGFSAAEHWLVGTAPTTANAGTDLGDLSNFKQIVTDVKAIAATGDLMAAEKRVTDFETAWDEAETTMRPRDPAAWGHLDDAADAVFSSLRASMPDPASVEETLANLLVVLDAPAPAIRFNKGVIKVDEVAVTDETGHPIACEKMLSDLSDSLAVAKPADTVLGRISTLRDQATERCNADDDTRANTFSAQAIALVAKGN